MLPSIPTPVDVIWFCLLLGLLAAIIIVPSRWLILIFLVLAGLLSLWDQMRWQPWFFIYFFILAAIGFSMWTKSESRKQSALDACRLIIASTYVWSGLQKLNVNFIRETWPDMSGPLLRLLPQALNRLPPYWVLVIPLLEISIGLGLITRKFRKQTVLLAIGTHTFVLALLVSSRENTVVWPWNIAMALFVVILFWQDKQNGPLQILAPRSALHALIIVLFGVMPAFSFADLWDSYLSSALYSGNADQSVIYVSRSVAGQLPAAIQPHIWQAKEPFFLDVNRWAYAELNVPVYPEPRIYRRVAAQICATPGSFPGEILLRIRKKPNLFTGLRKSEFYDCEHLM